MAGEGAALRPGLHLGDRDPDARRKLNGQKDAQRAEVETLHRVLESSLIKDWSIAVDGGAHVGTWTVVMAERFEKVIAFEPAPETFAILAENIAGFGNIELHNAALLDKVAAVAVIAPSPKVRTLTARYCVESATGKIRAMPLDSARLPSCGLIKLDLEGAEWSALGGAVKTIRAHKPVLIVEVSDLARRRGVDADAVHKRILGYGYREVFRAGVDRVYIGNAA